MKTTRYFDEQVMIKRSYLRIEFCENVVKNPLKRVVQEDGRIRYWGFVPELNKIIRVVLLEDDKTLHNAFIDGNFKIQQ